MSEIVKTSLLSRLWHFISYMGVKGEYPLAKRKNIIVVNQITLSISVIASTYIPLFWIISGYKLGLSMIVATLCYSLPFILNRYGRHEAGQYIFLATAVTVVSFYSIVFGKDSGIQLYFIVIMALPAIIIPANERKKRLWAICIIAVVYVALHVFGLSLNPLIESSSETLTFIKNMSEVGTVLIIILILSYLIKANLKAENDLQSAIKETSSFKFALDQSAIVAITDTKGDIEYANDMFCTLSKYSKEELIGENHRIINSGYHPKEFWEDLWATIGKGEVWKDIVRNKAKDGAF